ncbi:interleukin-27 subunit beta [Syngnathoides biaculeatus]|uniref:interleukin-27 subunit beta n=1 Tax=Syngnathoides biaculeatus TaxID=300417 RepID=UPI002ADE1441|nr:interleukin-27 subunit beta [Syngnathoides biaculeatus]
MTSARFCILLTLVVASETADPTPDDATSADSRLSPSVHCWCATYPKVAFCSWPEPQHGQPLRYIATYSERRQPLISKSCQLTSSSSSSSVRLWHCHLPDLKLLTDYILNVTTLSSAGRSSSLLRSFMLEDIVKPDPPVGVTVSARRSRKVLVEWSPPPTWTHLDVAPLKYQIMYQSDHKGRAKSVNLGPLESTSVELKGLSPGRKYTFQVCAKDLLGLGQCSLWSPPVTLTLPPQQNFLDSFAV